MDVPSTLKILVYALIGVTFLLLYFLEKFPSLRRFRMIQKLPGPKGIFYFGNASELSGVPTEDFKSWLASNMKQYKRLMRIWLLGVSHVYLKDPKDVQVVLHSKEHITKGVEYEFIKDWLNEGLLTSTGEKWFNRRKLLTPAFHFKILDDNMPLFNRNAKKLCQKMKEYQDQEVPIESLITLCTLDVIVSTSMGISMDIQGNKGLKYVDEIKRVSELLTYRSINPAVYKDWIFALTSVGRQFGKTVKYLHSFCYEVINRRKKETNESSDRDLQIDNTTNAEGGKVRRALLDTLLEIERNNPGTLSDKDIREEVDTFMFEGHDTTAAALTFIFFNLARFPDIQEKVYRELNEIFGNEDRDVTTKDLYRMVYLEKVIKESLRLFPSVPYISRMTEEDLVLEDGLTIPASTNIVIPIYVIHKNEDYWPDPDLFDPERFSDMETQKRHPYAYIPFSAGPRNCIGQKFAMMELKIVVSTVMRSLRIIPVTKIEEFKTVLYMVLRPNKKIMCKFIPR